MLAAALLRRPQVLAELLSGPQSQHKVATDGTLRDSIEDTALPGRKGSPQCIRMGELLDAARQVMRWTIPGSIFLLNIASMQIFIKLAKGESLNETLEPFTKDFAPVIAIVAGIPLGFLIYQVYYWRYSPLFWFRFPRADRGAELFDGLREDDSAQALVNRFVGTKLDLSPALQSRTAVRLLDIKQFHEEWLSTHPSRAPTPSFCLLKRWRGESAARTAYVERFYSNWTAVGVFLDYLNVKDERTALIRSEYTSQSDIYHALGATRTTAVYSLAAFLGYNSYFHWGYSDTYPERTAGAVVLCCMYCFFQDIFAIDKGTVCGELLASE